MGNGIGAGIVIGVNIPDVFAAGGGGKGFGFLNVACDVCGRPPAAL